MFTGLIQTQGYLEWLGSSQVRIRCPDLVADMDLGDSIAVDGLCLTVATLFQDGFLADVSPETLNRSTLKHRSSQHPVNLERSLRVGEKLGGHFVSGHIDGVGELLHSEIADRAWNLMFKVPPSIGRYVISKGSIAINGISLTIAAEQDQGCQFQVAVIPTTYGSTNLVQLRPGDTVNVEADILGKYVEKFLSSSIPPARIVTEDPLSIDFLVEHGYWS